jgi:[ribosomal protein S18]-alanine N-acetyltransferase
MSEREGTGESGPVTMAALVFRPMTQTEAQEVADWKYDDPYSFYDMSRDPDDLQELLDPTRRAQSGYHTALDGSDLVGFFAFRKEGDTVEIGLGLRPDLTGRGVGRDFLLAGLRFAGDSFAPQVFRLAVASFNKRAIRVYERVGFQRSRDFMHETNGGVHEFVEMVMNAPR